MYQVTIKKPTTCNIRYDSGVSMGIECPAGLTLKVSRVEYLPCGNIELQEETDCIRTLPPDAEIEIQRAPNPKVLVTDTIKRTFGFRNRSNEPVPYTFGVPEFGRPYYKGYLDPGRTYTAKAFAHSNGLHRFYGDDEDAYFISDADMVNVCIIAIEETSFKLEDAN